MINSDLNKITAAETYGKSFHEFSSCYENYTQ